MGLDNPLHIAILLVLLLLIFGAKRLPELGRSLGTGMRSFKESISGESRADEHAEQLAAAPAEPAPTVAAGEQVPASPPVSPAA
jgi:sec-independent protein translocase protein TatA